MIRIFRRLSLLLILTAQFGTLPVARAQTPPPLPPDAATFAAPATVLSTPVDVAAPAAVTPFLPQPTLETVAAPALITDTGVLPAAPGITITAGATATQVVSENPLLTETPPLTETQRLTESPSLTESPPLTATTEGAEAAPATEGGESITPLVSPTITASALLTATGETLTGLDAQVEQLLSRMSVADRVGQLFVVTFEGSDTSFESAIAELIYAYRVGGVVVSPENGNISNETGSDTATQMAVLANKLQAIAYGILLPDDVALQPVPNEPWPPANLVSLEREIGVTPPNLPLLIGAQQLGDNLPGTALRRGFTQLPSPLALGSTWNPQTTRRVGEIVGRELRAVGVNLLLGPWLDVFDQPATDLVGSLGIFSFGGNANWVSQMGRAYIQGLNEGSHGRVVSAASHFPGQGGIDRQPEEEVATIQRGIDELQRLSLPPFLAVTRPDGVPQAVTDILMSSHMRFGALQSGSGRTTPLSLDPVLDTLVGTWLGDWRAQGGILMSGPLGANAIRRVYDPSLQDFPARRVALDAFTAGHDLLYLDQFAQDDDWDRRIDNYRATIAFFQERYRSDPDFATHVDDAVRRILRMKLRMYGAVDGNPVAGGTPIMPIPLSQALVQESDLSVLPGRGAEPETAPDQAAPAQAARESATLLYPDPATTTLPPPPQSGETIVVVTDSRLQRECSTCLAEPAVDPDAIARIIVSLYGPEATGQIDPDSITSLTFSDLTSILRTEPGTVAATPPSPATAPAPTVEPASESAGGVVLPTPTPTPPLNAGAPPATTTGDASSAELEAMLANADWLIFSMLDVNALHPNSDVLRRYLRQRSDPQGEQRVAVLALNAPYFLDATEISKLSAYYGIYSKTNPFLESGVRALFRSFTPTGAPAMSAPGTRFGSLADRLAPSASAVIPLALRVDENVVASNSGAATNGGAGGSADTTGPAVVGVGQTVRLVAGPVLDMNGHPVPDGQPVAFEARFEGAELGLTIGAVQTSRGGMAERDVTLERGGILGVVAKAGAATSGDPVMVTVLDAQAAPTATLALQESTPATSTGPAAALPPPTGTLTATTGASGALPPLLEDGRPRINGVTLLLSLLTMVIVLSLLLLVQIRVLPRETLFKSLLWAIIIGLGAYLLYAQGWLPGSQLIATTFNALGAPIVVFVAMLLPLFWLQLRGGERP